MKKSCASDILDLVIIMSVVQQVLFEEVKRLEKNVSFYKNKLSKLPRGTIFIRKMGNAFFVYRKRKSDGKVITEYIGKKDSDRAYEEIEASKEYKQIKEDLQVASKELEKLKKAYRVYEK